MNVACYLVTDKGALEKALLPEQLLIDLAKSLREKGKETVGFVDKTLEVEGIFIPAKGTKHSIMVLPDIVE